MSTKTLLIAGIVVVVVIAAAAVVALGMGEEETHPSEGIIYDGNGGKTSSGSSTIDSKLTEVMSGNIFTKEGSVFQHWNTAKDDSGTTYYAGETLSYGSGSVRLYAIWYEGYTLTYTSYSTNFSLYHGSIAIGPTTPIKISQGELSFTVSTSKTGGEFSVNQDKMSVTYSIPNGSKTSSYTTYYTVKGATGASVELVNGVAILKVSYDGTGDVTISSFDSSSY